VTSRLGTVKLLKFFYSVASRVGWLEVPGLFQMLSVEGPIQYLLQRLRDCVNYLCE
jgi:hypothetical protein